MGIRLPVRGSVAARRCAWIVAIAADAMQIVFFPLFGEGIASIADDVLDVAVGVLMFLLLGWHASFVPALVAEVIPAFDLVPTWTAAVFLATRGAARTDVTPPPAPPARS
jgi:hypothetical protein